MDNSPLLSLFLYNSFRYDLGLMEYGSDDDDDDYTRF